MMRSQTIVTGGVVLLAAGAAITGLLWVQPAPSGAPSAVPVATAEITRGALRDTKTVTGTLSYGELSPLQPILTTDSAMVTWIAPIGSTVERGAPLYRLDGEPAILLYGSVPQHRTLRFDPDSTGPVWVELEQAQTAVESARLTLDLEHTRLDDAEGRTTDISARLADARSSTPAMPEFIQLAGAVRGAEAKLGRVQKLSTAQLASTTEVAAAEAELATAGAALDATIRGLRKDLSAAGLDAATGRVAVAEAQVKFDGLQSALNTLFARAADDSDAAQLANNLAALGYGGAPAEQVRAWQKASGFPVTGIVGPSQVVVARGAVHIAAHSAGIGEALTAASSDRNSILDYTSTQKQVTVPLGIGDHSLAAAGRTVTITLPDDTNVEGTISEVGSVVTDSTIAVIVAIADQAALGTIEVASVDVEFVSDGRDDVLSVPIAALLARPEGGFAVEMVADSGSTLVPVNTGLFATGRVEISGEGIAEGMRVEVPK